MTIKLADIDDESFIKAIESGSNYSEIARNLGLFNSSASTKVKNRINHLGISFTVKPSQLKSDNEFFRKGVYHNLHNLRRRLLTVKSCSYTCAVCGRKPEWEGKPLILEVDYINGNSSDNRLSNLRWICPNCHSQTATYRTKNRHSCRTLSYYRTCAWCGKEFIASSRHKNTVQINVVELQKEGCHQLVRINCLKLLIGIRLQEWVSNLMYPEQQ